MKPYKANLALLQAALTHQDISRMLGVSRALVGMAVRGVSECRIGSRTWRIRAKICELTGKQYGELWPLEDPVVESAIGKI